MKDFFIADVFDSLPFKDDMASMEHPIFSLSTKPETRSLEYKRNNVSITIKPTIDGLPTIFDKDILLYCGSLLMEQINKGTAPSRTLRISAHDLLISTKRLTNGDSYNRLRKALQRLEGVSITTNIKTNRRLLSSGFGLIDSWRVIESSRVKRRMVRLEITLSEWFYNSLMGKEVLTINPDYFQLRKPLERRLYELARKHCGQQKDWNLSLKVLQEKTGSTSSEKLFRYYLRKIEKENCLPDYHFKISKADFVTFRPKSLVQLQVQRPQESQIYPDAETLERARQLVVAAGTGWDFNFLQQDFAVSLIGGFAPENVNGAFISFVKKKVVAKP